MKNRSFALILVFVIVLQSFVCSNCYASTTTDQTEANYRDITKKILLTGIELERFSLNYRLEGAKQPKFKRLRYFLSQEAGAAGGLAFETIAVKQLGQGRKNPLKVDVDALRGGLRATLVTSIIAGSGSGLELGSNALLAIKNRRRGFDSRSANKYVIGKIKLLDELLAQRDALVQANKDHPAYASAVSEGRVLKQLRNASLFEYSQFHQDLKKYRVTQNVFYTLNILTNTTGAISSHYAIKGLKQPTFNGTANILFIISGALATASPLVATFSGQLISKLSSASLARALKEKPGYDPTELRAETKLLQDSLLSLDSTEKQYSTAVWRSGEYIDEAENFRKQLDRETAMMRHLEKVAVQSDLLGPPIGGTLLTQGILGTVGYYKYGNRPRKNLDLGYKGAIVGTVGTSVAVGATAAGFIADCYYIHRLRKNKRLPAQLIEKRLEHLDEVEKTVQSL